MARNTARPDNLEDFARTNHQLDRRLESTLRELTARYEAFLAENRWGHFDASSLLNGFGRYVEGNDFTSSWVRTIAEAFRAADAPGGVATLPDFAIKRSLAAAGLDRWRHHVHFKDPIAYGFPQTTGYTNDPINTATGNFVHDEQDLACARLAAGLTFTRTYNSRSDRVGAFGRGWSSWADARLIASPDGEAAYAGPDGQEARFARAGDGFARVAGIQALVEEHPSGLVLAWFDGRRWEFDEAGLPVATSHGPGTEIRFSHDHDGRLVELAHAGGRRVAVRWDEDGERIVALACSDGRRAAYRYDDSGALIEVDGPSGTQRYELDDAGLIASIADADGVVAIVNTYDADGRVVSQLSPFGRRTHLVYLPGGVTVTMDDDAEHPANTFVHDEHGRLLAVADGEEHELSIAYDRWGNPSAVTDRNGAVTTQRSDERGHPLRRVLPTGVEATYAYDEAGRLVELALSTGAVTRLSYDGEERIPSQVVDPEGGTTRMDVAGGVVRRFTDPDGVVFALESDADGKPVAATDADGNRGYVEYDAAGRVSATVTPGGGRSERAYDERGRLAQLREPSGAVWRYEHTAAGRLVAVTDPTGGRTERRFGAHGEVAALTDPLGNTTALEYDVYGNVAALVEADGARWRHAYDGVMRLTETIDPAGGTWRREYDPTGTLVARTDPSGVRLSAEVDRFGRVVAISDGLVSERYELDALGRTVAVQRADGTRTRVEYDQCNRRTLVEGAGGAITRIAYTPAGRVASITHPTGRVERFEYDACGRAAARVDGAGRRWEQRYDADGRAVETLLPTGEAQRARYDAGGRLLARSAPGEGETSYRYDAAGRVVASADRVAGARAFGYDAAGRLVAATDANGATTTFEYDERGRAVRIVDPLGGATTRRYDAVGRIVELTDPLGRSTRCSYDGAGRPLLLTEASGRTLARGYDASGRLVAVGAADAAPIEIGYDALGMPALIEEPGALANRLLWDPSGRLVERARGDLALRWEYDLDGARAALAHPDGSATTYMRDDAGRVAGVQHPALGEIALERDALGRLIGAEADGMRALWRYQDGDLVRYEMRAAGVERTATLRRDAQGRVVGAVVDGDEHEFAYDAAGQLVAATGPGGAREFAYDANGRLVRERTAGGEVSYAYDAAGQLLTRTGPDGSVVRFEYDGGGRRVLEAGGGSERRYEWDELGRLTRAGDTRVVVDALGELAELDGTPLLWDTASPLSPLAWRGTEAVVGEGAPWALAGAGAARWLAPDWQGTVGDAPRDPWGAPAAATPQLGYRGELEFDGETWLRHRVYQPATRAFAQPDPLLPAPATASAANPYHYAFNNPIGLADPLGLHPVTDEELQHIRDRMDRNILDRADDVVNDTIVHVTDFVYDHAGTLSAIAGVLALVPPLTPFMAPLSIGFGGLSAVHSISHHDYLGAAFDIAALVPGIGGYVRGTAATLTIEAAEAEDAVRLSLSLHPSIRGEVSQLWRAQLESTIAQAEHEHAIAHLMDQQAAGIASAAALRAETMPDHEHADPNPLNYRDPHPPARIRPVHLTPSHP